VISPILRACGADLGEGVAAEGVEGVTLKLKIEDFRLKI
jgi:hypothetical protein